MEQQGTSNQAASGAPEGTGTGTTSSFVPSRANLGRLHDLPPEIRVMIYQRVLDHDATPMVRSLVYSFSRPDFSVQSADLVNLRPQSWGLFTTVPEALFEASRLGWVRLPVSYVTFPGANVAHPDRGLTDQPLESRSVGGGNRNRLFSPETTVFYIDQASLITLVTMVSVGHNGPSGRFAWLTDLAVDRRTFEHLHFMPRPLGSDRPQPLSALPGLRRVIVGFLHRWQDVAVVDGPLRDVIEEARVEVHYTALDENDSGGEPTIQGVDVQLEDLTPALELMISETVRQTDSLVRALNQAGVNVVWAFIRQGVTRRLDIEAGPRHVRR
ncbi:hypothetical protein PG984_010380 [Apiospora sp. TS-2023a]